MKYNFTIYQKGFLDTNSKITLKEMAIMSWLRDICAISNEKMVRKEVDNTYYTWVNYDWLIQDLPCLKIKSKGTLTKILQNLKKYGFILIDLQTKATIGFKTFISITKKGAIAMDTKQFLDSPFPQEKDKQPPISSSERTDSLQETNPLTIDPPTSILLRNKNNHQSKKPSIQMENNDIYSYFVQKVLNKTRIQYRINYGRDGQAIKRYRNAPLSLTIPIDKQIKAIIDYWINDLTPDKYEFISLNACLSNYTLKKFQIDKLSNKNPLLYE